MSKGSLFWANASGKLGETVLYRSGGEQRTRTYVAKIKNPKTLAQMKNRALMNNVVSAFHAMKPLLQATFPNRKANQSAFNAFVQANKNRAPYYITKEDLSATAFVPYGLQLAKGSLGINIEPKIMPLTNARDKEAAPKFYHVIEGLLNLKDFEIEVDPDRFEDPCFIPTPAEWVEIFQKCCLINVPSEFQLSTICAAYGADDEDLSTDIWQAGYTITHCQKFNGYSKSYGLLSKNFSQVGLWVKSYKYTNDETKVKLTFDKLVSYRGMETADDAVWDAYAFVLSFKENGSTQVTNSYFTAVPREVDYKKVEDPTEDYVFGGFYAQQVLESYGYKANDALTSTALNVSATPADEEQEEEEGGEDLTT